MTIKDICREYHLTISDIAEEFHIPIRTVENWSSGSRVPPPYITDMIVRILNQSKEG